MKNFLKVTIVTVFFLTGTNLFAQTVKLGHIDSNKLLSIMPEKEEAEKKIQTQASEYDSQIKKMEAEYRTLVEDYVSKESTLSDVIKADKQKAIQDLQTRVRDFNAFAQKELQKKQTELLEPIFNKATKAIKDVGTENGFTYIFDISTGVVLFQSDNSIDVMSLVKAKLGL